MWIHGESKKTKLPTREEALPGRDAPMPVPEHHFVHGRRIVPPLPEGLETVDIGMGCFWGAERKFWKIDGVYTTAVGYGAGFTKNPTYKEVCTGETGHNELVRIVFDPTKVSLETLLQAFWENHDPTQGMRQGGDIGTQYRSGIYTHSAHQHQVALASRAAYQAALTKAGLGTITTEILEAPEFFFAEEYHQQYLAKNPDGYCGLGGTGVSCPVGLTLS